MSFSVYYCPDPHTLDRIERNHRDSSCGASIGLRRASLLITCGSGSHWFGFAESLNPSESWMVLDGYLADDQGGVVSLNPNHPLESLNGSALDRLGGRHVLVAGRFAGGRWTLHARRDPLGGRTAYWAHRGDLFAVSSSAHALARLPEIGLDQDSSWISQHFSLRQERLPGRSAYRNVHELLPGEHLIFDGAKTRSHRTPIDLNDDPPVTSDECLSRFGTAFERAVRESVADHDGVAVMLSGGLDSGPIAALAARALAERGATLHAVSWSLDSIPEADETGWIRQIADHLNLPLELFPGESFLPFSDLRPESMHPDSPAYNAYRPVLNECYRRAADLGCGVVLNGNGGDLLYPLRLWLPALLARHGHWRALMHELRGLLDATPPWRWHRNPALRFLVRNRISRTGPLRRPRPPEWLIPAAAASLPPPTLWPPEALDHPVPEFAAQALGTRIGAATSYENNHAAALCTERREPFAHPDLIRLMLALPPRMSRFGETTKWIMRRFARDANLLPEVVCAKPRSGILGRYYDAGFSRHRDDIRALLDDHRDWREWVNPNVIEAALRADTPDPMAAMITAAAVGYELWNARIRG